MSQPQEQLGKYEFRIPAGARAEFLRKVEAALKGGAYIMAERHDGADVIMTVVPTMMGEEAEAAGQALAGLAEHVDVRTIAAGQAESELDF